MNMVTKLREIELNTTAVGGNEEKINAVIKEEEKNGWQMRGKPELVKDRYCWITFEKNSESEDYEKEFPVCNS